jgi:aminobenzoyl-glutamate utilization protein A
MKKLITEFVTAIEPELVQLRRDFHKHAEVGWTEFRTTAILAKKLIALGYEVEIGEKVIKKEAMMGVPKPDTLQKHQQRAIAQGADPELVAQMAGGMTGLVATLRCGEGPVVALRFDIDANDISEAQDAKHRPYRDGFASVNAGMMHACGHDGHAAAGLGVARVIMKIRDQLSGTVKLIFEPGEEGSRGASAMEAAGILNGVDFIFGGHLGLKAQHVGDFICRTGEFLATTKLDITFTGKPAHAGGTPEEGRNALLAAATCAVNLHAISRHSQGVSRVNVGLLHAGQGRNVIAPNAYMQVETRGVTTEIEDFMSQEARRIIAASALMYAVDHEIECVGGTKSGVSDCDMAELVRGIAQEMTCFTNIMDYASLGLTEDFSHLMTTVQKAGGKGTYVQVGADLVAGHHQFYFDFNEKAISQLTELMARVVYQLLGR